MTRSGSARSSNTNKFPRRKRIVDIVGASLAAASIVAALVVACTSSSIGNVECGPAWGEIPQQTYDIDEARDAEAVQRTGEPAPNGYVERCHQQKSGRSQAAQVILLVAMGMCLVWRLVRFALAEEEQAWFKRRSERRREDGVERELEGDEK